MFQKFYTDTLGSRFIKSLLAQTPIPVFDSVVDGDHIVEGCYYVYRRFIIRCKDSGILSVPKSELDRLYPSNTIYPSVFLYPNSGYRPARFYVISMLDPTDKKVFSTYDSATNYYDAETHYHLGRYLRYIYTTTDRNLFAYYNSYNSTLFSDIELIRQPDTYNKMYVLHTNREQFKVIGVPILFGHTYTIAIDSPSEVRMRAVIHDDLGYVDEATLPEDLASTLDGSGIIYSRLSFDRPVEFRVETQSPSSIHNQKNLYLVIQLNKNNDSSITVLENYTSSGVICTNSNIRVYDNINPSLLRANTKVTYAFSDRLIEYLLENIISSDEVISQNIAKIQTALATIHPEYKNAFLQRKYKKGIYDSSLANHVMNLVESSNLSQVKYDQDGSVNKDVEFILQYKGVKY